MTQATLEAEKKAARSAAFGARKLAHGMGLDGAANGFLTKHILNQPAKIIAGYMAIRTEIDPLETMTRLHAAGRMICVPVIKSAGEPLAFHHWSPECPMIDGPFGARVPADADVLIPDLVIAPLVGFDRNFTRLGYGGGFYDRSLVEIRKVKAAPALGFAYRAQELPKLPVGKFDIALDAIFTETGPV